MYIIVCKLWSPKCMHCFKQFNSLKFARTVFDQCWRIFWVIIAITCGVPITSTTLRANLFIIFSWYFYVASVRMWLGFMWRTTNWITINDSQDVFMNQHQAMPQFFGNRFPRTRWYNQYYRIKYTTHYMHAGMYVRMSSSMIHGHAANLPHKSCNISTRISVHRHTIHRRTRRLAWQPWPQMSMLNNVHVTCLSCWGWFLLSTRLNP